MVSSSVLLIKKFCSTVHIWLKLNPVLLQKRVAKDCLYMRVNLACRNKVKSWTTTDRAIFIQPRDGTMRTRYLIGRKPYMDMQEGVLLDVYVPPTRELYSSRLLWCLVFCTVISSTRQPTEPLPLNPYLLCLSCIVGTTCRTSLHTEVATAPLQWS